MAVAPVLFLVYEKIILPRLAKRGEEREADVIDEKENPVILAGFGRFGNIVGRLLINAGVGVTVLDNDQEQVELLRKFGLKTFYGDATRLDLLRSAGAENAKLILLTLASEERSLRLVEEIREHFPKARIMARAHSRQHAYALIRAGVTEVYRDTLETSLTMGVDALRAVGFRGPQALRAARLFREHDEAAVREMATIREDSEEYFSAARKHRANLDAVLRADREELIQDSDEAWDSKEDRKKPVE
jgi:voltage-gated potassium channel Kch